MLSNHHTHTLYSDGHADPEEYVKSAIELKLEILGFSEHSPLPFANPFSFRQERRDEYLQKINLLKSQYADKIRIYCAMECDYIPGVSEPFVKTSDEFTLDYVIGSVHLVKPDNSEILWFTDGPDYKTYDEGLSNLFAGDIKNAVRTYYRQINSMIENEVFDVIGHFDKIKMHNRDRFFLESEKWYTDLLYETIDLIAEKDLIVEVNTRGIYKKRSETTYPGHDSLKILKAKNVRVMINSDAHQPHELLMSYDVAQGILDAAGYKASCHFIENEWQEIAL
jgi:histidinol-phosphatase (PHP family)